MTTIIDWLRERFGPAKVELDPMQFDHIRILLEAMKEEDGIVPGHSR